MNKQITHKSKKHSTTHQRNFPAQINVKDFPHLKSIGQCQPKTPPNITQHHQYAHPRRIDMHKENNKFGDNEPYLQKQKEKNNKNILFTKPINNYSQIKKTQKKKKTIKNQEENNNQKQLNCLQSLISQLYRPVRSDSRSKTIRKLATPLRNFNYHKSNEELLRQFQQNYYQFHRQQTSFWLDNLVKKQEMYSHWQNYPNYLIIQTQVSWMKRAMIIDYMIKFCAQHSCKRQTLGIAVNFLDRYLAVTPKLPLKLLQLKATACLMLAQKMQDNCRLPFSFFYQQISEKHTTEDLVQTQQQIAFKLKFKLNPPTIIQWTSRLCTQWDMWAELHQLQIAVRFKSIGLENFYNWLTIAQLVDFILLDIETLQYKNRTLAASLLYITLLLKLQIYQASFISSKFRTCSSLIIEDTEFNKIYSRFLVQTFGFPIEQILPIIQYCSIYAVLPFVFDQPKTDEQELISYEEYCRTQTWNCNMLAKINRLNRQIW